MHGPMNVKFPLQFKFIFAFFFGGGGENFNKSDFTLITISMCNAIRSQQEYYVFILFRLAILKHRVVLNAYLQTVSNSCSPPAT